MKKALFSLAATAAILSSSQADTLGVEAGIGIWQTDLSGYIKKGTDSFDLKDDLGYGDSETNNYFYASFEHPIPLVPNIKIQHTKLKQSATGTMTKTATFNGKSFSASANVDSNLQLNQTDFILYYELLENWINLDLGLNAKHLNASINLKSGSTETKESIDTVIPMLYAKAKFDLPFTGLSAESDISYITMGGNTFSDMKAGLLYEAPYGLGVTLGYRAENLTIDDIDDVYSDIDAKGFYLGAYYHF